MLQVPFVDLHESNAASTKKQVRTATPAVRVTDQPAIDTRSASPQAALADTRPTPQRSTLPLLVIGVAVVALLGMILGGGIVLVLLKANGTVASNPQQLPARVSRESSLPEPGYDTEVTDARATGTEYPPSDDVARANDSTDSVASSPTTQVVTSPARFSTPNDAFDAYINAMLESRWTDYFNALSPASQDLAIRHSIRRMVETNRSQPDIFQQLVPFGFTVSAPMLTAQGQSLADAIDQALANRPSEITDRAALFAATRPTQAAFPNQSIQDELAKIHDVLAELKSENPILEGLDMPEVAPFELADLQIDGDHARANQVMKGMNLDIDTPIAFVRIDGAWFIDLTVLTTPFPPLIF
ncbi:MAG: hypothetical protein R3E01_26485 [Pirellulaceae bacterium]|nr:hypothetical protein [Planctomycetales bacterium]